MLELRQLVPNWTVEDLSGRAYQLWDFRQKSHLVLIYIPEAAPPTQDHWARAILLDRKQWDWLNVTMLLLRRGPEEMKPGVYLIDRYGLLLSFLAPDGWTFDAIEREFLYYEARHC